MIDATMLNQSGSDAERGAAPDDAGGGQEAKFGCAEMDRATATAVEAGAAAKNFSAFRFH